MKKLRGHFAALLTSKAVRVGIMGVVALMFVTIFNTAAFAQNDVGTIVGEVSDPTGAVIPNASVTVTNEGTGETRTVLSDAAGRYTAANMAPTQYTISVTASGFEKYVSTHNTLKSNSTVEIDAKLTVGAASQSVQVSDTAQVLQTQSAAVQSEVTGSQVQKLELNGRNPIYMTQFNPGVTGTTTLGDFNWSMNSGDSFNVNGARSQDIEYWIDGAPAVRTRDDGEIIAGVTTDAVQEMQVLTADYQAEYGTGSGAEIRIVTKSGTRDFHGGLYEYLRNSAAIANTYSRNENSTTQFTTPFRYNNFGFFVGGPVWIPKTHVLSGTRDKVFFFIDEDWIRLRQDNTLNNVVPTNLMRQGNFSELNTTNPWYSTANGPVYLTDPSSCYVGGTYTQSACTTYFAETGTNAIPNYVAPTSAAPGGSFVGNPLPNSPNGMAFIAAYPVPTPNYLSGADNEEGALAAPENQRKGQYNLDILMTPNQHLEFRRSDNSYYQYSPNNGNFNLVPLIYNRPNQANSLGWEWTIKPTMINEARVTVSDDDVYIAAGPLPALLPGQSQNNGYDRQAFGWNFNYIYPVSVQPKGTSGSPTPNKIPTDNVPTFTQVAGSAYPSHSSGIIYALSDSLTWVKGNHTLKFGFYGNKMGENDNDQINVSTVPGGANNQAGQFLFSNDQTGVGLANVMLGLSDNYAEIGQKAYTDWRGYMWEGFAQDSWQVNPKLHLDYGLRVTTVTPPYGQWGNTDYFDPASYNSATAPTVDPVSGLINTSVSTNPFDGVVIPGFSSFPSSANGRVSAANSANWTNSTAVLASCENEPCSNLFAPGIRKGYVNQSTEWQPRVGFAYQLKPTTVIRGGAGRFTQDKLIVDNIFPGGNSPFQPTVTVTAPTSSSATTPNPNGGATTGPYQQVDGPANSLVGTDVPPLTITTMNKNLLPPSRYDWNVSFQQEFANLHSTLNVAYVGAVGNHNWQVYDINQPAAGTTLPGVHCQPGTSGTTCPIDNIATLRPYQGFSTIQQMRSVTNAKYKGLQVAWNSHFTEGSSLSVAYSLSRTMDNGSNYHDIAPDTYYNLNLWSLADFNIKSALLVNYDYALPFFKGRHDLAGQVLGGWEISGADQFQTGEPSSVVGSGDYAGISTGGAVIASNGTSGGSADGSISNAGEFWGHTQIPGLSKGYAGPAGTGAPWFGGYAIGNTTNSALWNFIAPQAGTFIKQPGVRNLISNPGLQDWNLSAVKAFPINESNAFEFHADVYDVWNHANLNGANFSATSSQFGLITGKSGLVRTIQAGLKYRF